METLYCNCYFLGKKASWPWSSVPYLLQTVWLVVCVWLIYFRNRFRPSTVAFSAYTLKYVFWQINQSYVGYFEKSSYFIILAFLRLCFIFFVPGTIKKKLESCFLNTEVVWDKSWTTLEKVFEQPLFASYDVVKLSLQHMTNSVCLQYKKVWSGDFQNRFVIRLWFWFRMSLFFKNCWTWVADN